MPSLKERYKDKPFISFSTKEPSYHALHPTQRNMYHLRKDELIRVYYDETRNNFSVCCYLITKKNQVKPNAFVEIGFKIYEASRFIVHQFRHFNDSYINFVYPIYSNDLDSLKQLNDDTNKLEPIENCTFLKQVMRYLAILIRVEKAETINNITNFHSV